MTPTPPLSELDAALRTERDPKRLMVLHQAASAALDAPAAQRFHLTHAWVYALVCGDDAEVAHLERELQRRGGV